jgi:predicted RND superfamily exporter protein
MAIASLVIIGVGALLIIIGAVVTVVDWKDQRAKRNAHPGVEGKAMGLDDTIGALEKLLKELAKHPLGTRMIALGIVCVLIGGVLGGVAGLTGS